MPREITDEDGTVWSCVQAYAGLDNNEEKAKAPRVKGTNNLVQVIATPSGGAQTVRLELESNWEESVSDEKLLDKIKEKQ
jgi:hypothetical protein